ncbi:MAG: TlpA family protein disulfide reductase, partial [Actinobacteria bacterium]|nr:TlpA family protein disulfide reductase [Actinomycetota bacterium]
MRSRSPGLSPTASRGRHQASTWPPELPEFSLPLLVGKGELDSDQLAGHPTVLNFWASWCPPCREETPLLEKTWRSYKDRGVRFVGVNLRDASANAKDFVRK